MSSYPNEGMSERSMPSQISFFSKGKKTISQVPISFYDPLRALPPSTPTNSGPPQLACPVSSCLFAFKRETPNRCLRRHLKHPGIHERVQTGKGQGSIRIVLSEVWYTNHIRFNHNPNPKKTYQVHHADRVDIIKLVEVNNAEEESNSRAVEFEFRARNMGITEEKFVAQKVAIWEGMWAAKQNGDDIGVSILYPVPL